MSDPTPTWSITELHDALTGLFEHVFGDEIWVEGELRNVKRSSRQHVYFDLVDPGSAADAKTPMLSVTLFDRERQAVNRHLRSSGGSVRMVDGVRVRIRGRLTTYPARSSLQLRMSWIDPTYTLGVMGRERDRVLAALAADGLLDRNGRLVLAEPPLRVAIVTSVGSAAHADALDELRRSGIGFQVTVLDARTQGVDAERSIVRALRVAATLQIDVVALVRGGGARTDLASFDSELVARTIASLDVPVITGIGHEIDRTVADDVAHTSHKTPTAAAAALVDACRAAERELHDAWVRVSSAVQGRLVRAERSLDQAARDAGRAAVRHLEREAQRVEHVAERIGPAARRSLERCGERLEAAAARARAHDPEVALARGWSITRRPDGTVVRSVATLAAGDRTITTLADGSFTSTVEGSGDT